MININVTQLTSELKSEKFQATCFYGWKSNINPSDVFDIFLDIIKQFCLSPKIFLASGVKNEDITGEKNLYNFLKKSNSVYEIVIRNELSYFPGVFNLVCLYGDNTLYSKNENDIKYLCISNSLKIGEINNSILKSMVDLVFSEDYGYGFQLIGDYWQVSQNYMTGISITGKKFKFEDQFKWYKNFTKNDKGIIDNKIQQGLMRFVYPKNYLNNKQLLYNIYGKTLREWILEKEQRGILNEISCNSTEWIINQSEIENVTRALGENGLLISYDSDEG